MAELTTTQKLAVDSGYWPLYRYNPGLQDKGEIPFQLDSRRIKKSLQDYLQTENRYSALNRANNTVADHLQGGLNNHNLRRMEHMQRSAMDEMELLDQLKENIGESSGDKVLILYASETGTTAGLAKHLTYEMKRRDIRCKALPFDDYDVSNLPREKTVINLVATCGQGEFPQNSKLFFEEFSNPELPSDYLKDVFYATFAMGDKGYVFYNTCGLQIDERWEALGGKRILPVGMGNDQDEDKWETAYNDWEPELWQEMGTPPPPKVMLPSTHIVQIKPVEDAVGAAIPEYIVPRDAVGSGTLLPMTKSKRITPGGRDVRHYEWDISGTNINYSAGDALGVFSTNGVDRVHEFLHFYGLKPDDVIFIAPRPGNDGLNLPPVVTAEQLFCQHFDIFGRPKRPFYEMMSILATDETERLELERLIEKEGKDDMRSLINDTVTYADILVKYPSCKPGIDQLLDFVPAIKPRLYSISSDSLMHEDTIHCCIVEEDWENSQGARHGQSTWFLRNQTENMKWGQVKQLRDQPEEPFGELSVETAPKMFCRVNPAVVHLPESPKTPLIMVGLGTGLAPFRSFIQQRKMQEAAGEEVGEMVLYFGARYKETEFLYRDEMEQWEKEGLILKLAFSRDQEQKIYAQHKIDEDPELIYDLMMNKGASFYLCGPAGNMPTQMKESVINAIAKVGKMPTKEAEEIVTQWQINGRYNVEVW